MSDWVEQYKIKLKEAEKILNECEEILKTNGVVGPSQQPAVYPRERIWFPSGYIRTANYFRDSYKLRTIIADRVTRNNIAYALQYSDLLNYIINRFHLGDFSVGNIFYRMASAHLFTIIESMLYGITNSFHVYCVTNDKVCNKSQKCDLYLKKGKKYKFNKLLEELNEKSILSLTDEDAMKLKTLKDVRDRLHMWNTVQSDFQEVQFKVSTYNDAIVLLSNVKDTVIETVPNYMMKRNEICQK